MLIGTLAFVDLKVLPATALIRIRYVAGATMLDIVALVTLNQVVPPSVLYSIVVIFNPEIVPVPPIELGCVTDGDGVCGLAFNVSVCGSESIVVDPFPFFTIDSDSAGDPNAGISDDMLICPEASAVTGVLLIS